LRESGRRFFKDILNFSVGPRQGFLGACRRSETIMEEKMKNLSKLSVLLLVVLLIAFGAGNALGAGKYPRNPSR